MENRRSIIIDTDPGIDDAVAIAMCLFSDKLKIELITTVAGNVDIDKTTDNILKLLKFYKKDTKVAKGSSVPLIRKPIYAKNVHGESGMDGYDFGEVDYSPLLSENAVEAMYKKIMEINNKITILAIGPLTNVALLLKVYPEVKEKIEEIVLMGGSLSRGNMGVLSEFNIHCDPDAAKIVFNSGVNLAIAPLDVGLKALVFPEDSAKIKAMNKSGEMIYSLFKHYRSFGLRNGLKMYDSCAVAYLLKPEMFEIVDTFVDVEICGEYAVGATIIDLKNYLKREANARVCIDINQEMFKDWLLESLNKCNID